MRGTGGGEGWKIDMDEEEEITIRPT